MLIGAELCGDWLRADPGEFEQTGGDAAERRGRNETPNFDLLHGNEQRALWELQRGSPDTDFVFCTERCDKNTRLSVFAPAANNATAQQTSDCAGMPFPVYALMLTHACDYTLVNAGRDTRTIQAGFGTRHSSTPLDTPNYLRSASRTCGAPRARSGAPAQVAPAWSIGVFP